MSEDPALLQQQYDYADLAAKVAYQQAIIHGEDETRALNAAIQASDNALKSLSMVTSLQGPRNAFQQQAMEVGLNRAGYSNAIDALAGRYTLPAFGQQFATAQPQSIQTIAGDMAANPGNTGAVDPVTAVMNQLFGQLGWTTGSTATGYGAPAGGTVTPTIPSSSTSSPTSTSPTSTSTATTTATPTSSASPSSTVAPWYQTAGVYPTQQNNWNVNTNNGSYMPTSAQVASQLSALPALNKADPRAWANMSPDTREFVQGAYSTAGQSPTDLLNAIQRNAPAFRAPTFGSITGG